MSTYAFVVMVSKWCILIGAFDNFVLAFGTSPCPFLSSLYTTHAAYGHQRGLSQTTYTHQSSGKRKWIYRLPIL